MREAFCAAIADEPDLIIAGQVANIEDVLDRMIGTQSGDDLPSLIPDIILFALGNPGQDELEIISSLRKSLPDTAILALTNNEVDGQDQAALEAGAQIALGKTESRQVLIGALHSLKVFKVDVQKLDFEENLNHYLSGLEDEPSNS